MTTWFACRAERTPIAQASQWGWKPPQARQGVHAHPRRMDISNQFFCSTSCSRSSSRDVSKARRLRAWVASGFPSERTFIFSLFQAFGAFGEVPDPTKAREAPRNVRDACICSVAGRGAQQQGEDNEAFHSTCGEVVG